MNNGRRQEARRMFLHTLALDPNNDVAMSDLSFVELCLGRLDDALYWARRQAALRPNEPNAAYHVAVALLWLRDDEMTARFLEATIAVWPRFAP
jgi:Flp pilus assembly protein TadD